MEALHWLPLAASLLAASVMAGLLAGMLGVGGGIVIVPVLFWLLSQTDITPGLAAHIAVATSMATIVATSISSARAHYGRGAVDMEILWAWGPAIAIGAVMGGILAGSVNGTVLKVVFAVMATFVAMNMSLPKALVLRPSLPRGRAANYPVSWLIGLLSAMMGIGGGTLAVPTLVAFSVPVKRAIGTASVFGLLIAVPATLGYIATGWSVPGRPPASLGYVNLAAVAVILPATTALAPYGARLTHRFDPLVVRRVFSAFLAVTAARIFWSLLAAQ